MALLETEVMNFIAVLAVAVGVACAVGSLYGLGLRFWAQGGIDEQGNARIAKRTCSVVCFTACVAIVLFALWLMIPLFH